MLSFDDPQQPQCDPDSLLNQRIGLFADDPNCPDGNPGRLEQGSWGDASFSATDCDSASTIETGVANPLTEEEITAFVPGVVVPTFYGAERSHYESANRTLEGTVEQCNGESKSDAFYFPVESGVTTAEGVKRETSFAFEFGGAEFVGVTSALGSIFVDAFGEDMTEKTVRDALAGTPTTLGIGAIGNFNSVGFSPMWWSHVSSTAYGVPPTQDDGVKPHYYTFYARVGAVTLATGAITPGGQGTYGVEWCGGNTQDVIRGFDCDGAHWWKEEWGASAMATEVLTGREIGQYPGALYNLRDIDCYDGTLSSAAPGVGLGLTLLDETHGPC